MMDRLKQTYQLLMDDESKYIWLNKMNWLITKDDTYMDNIRKKVISKYILLPFSETSVSDLLGTSKDIIVYGAGDEAEKNICLWRMVKQIKCFCDKDTKKQGKEFYGYEVISPQEMVKKYKDANIVISSRKYREEIRNELLNAFGFLEENIYYLNEKGLWYYQYFDKDIIKWSEKEIFIDAGSCELGTVRRFLQHCPAMQKAYAFEPDKDNIEKMYANIEKHGLSNVEILPYGTYSEEKILRFHATGSWDSSLLETGETEVPVTSIDKSINDKVTFIKMDVEGAELESLKGARNTILKYKPKLAICLYHKPEDMYEIPLYIKSLVPEYSFYVRHYALDACETVLYAVLAD